MSLLQLLMFEAGVGDEAIHQTFESFLLTGYNDVIREHSLASLTATIPNCHQAFLKYSHFVHRYRVKDPRQRYRSSMSASL